MIPRPDIEIQRLRDVAVYGSTDVTLTIADLRHIYNWIEEIEMQLLSFLSIEEKKDRLKVLEQKEEEIEKKIRELKSELATREVRLNEIVRRGPNYQCPSCG